MRTSRLLLALSLSAAAFGFAPMVEDTYTLIWKPKEGQSTTYDVEREMSAEGQTLVLKNELIVKVTKVEENGNYTVEMSERNRKFIAEGQETAIPADPDEKPQIEKYDARGNRIEEKEEEGETDELSGIMGQIVEFDPPEKGVKVGDKWTQTLKANEKKKEKAAKLEFEVAGTGKVEGTDVVRVTLTYKQTEGSKPVTADGTIQLDKSDFSLVKFDVTVDDAPFDEETRGRIKIKMTRS